MKITRRELARLHSKARIRVADIPLRSKPAASEGEVAQWLEDLDMLRAAFLQNDPLRLGAAHLTELDKMIRETRTAIAGNDAQRAAWAGMRTMHAAWAAMWLDAEPVIRHGVTTGKQHLTNFKNANAEVKAKAHADVLKPFDAYRRKYYHNSPLTLPQIARRYHKSMKDQRTPVSDRNRRRLNELIRAEKIT